MDTSYKIHLQQFDGPLDLLLHLIEQAKVDIKDIFVSEITSQYLEYVAQMQAFDMNIASEFLTTAATLLYIKSRHLLPRQTQSDDEEADPEKILIRQLSEYKLFKELSQKLDVLQQNAGNSYSRLPEELITETADVQLGEISVDMLFQAFFSALQQRHESTPTIIHEIHKDVFTVRQQSAYIRKLLLERPVLSFHELFTANSDKMEMIVTFMALLEMINRQEVLLHQSRPFEPITIQALKIRNDDQTENYMDEIEAYTYE